MLDWSVAALEAVCDRVVVAVPAELADDAPGRIAGGASRSESVKAAVLAEPEAGVYVVQDAARPLVTPDLVARCAAAVSEGWDAAVAAAPVADTIKQADSEGRVERTLDRSVLWATQTPQAFDGAALRRALDVDRATLAAATDDASLVEAIGGSVRVVEVLEPNPKVTTPSDLRLAELLLDAD